MPAPKVAALVLGWDVFSGHDPGATLQAARRAEELALDSIIVGDHVTFFGHGNDGLITLAAVAAVTSTIELKTSVYLLPLRHPVPVALQAAQVDQLSMGRLVLGIGIGGEDPHEFESCGVDPHTRGARTNEAIQVLKRLWTEDDVTFDGRHFQLKAVTVYPKPIRPVPVYVGGRSDAALRRAGRYGDGYTGIWQSVDRFRQARETVAEAAAKAGRDPAAVEMGMQFWTGIAANRAEARAKVSSGMEAMYRIPFERFERYTPYGSPAEIAEFIAPYVEAGAAHVNVVATEGSAVANVEAAAAVQQALKKLLS